MSGLFIAFEGVDGAGKSTQVAALRDHFAAQGREVTIVREPGGTPLGEELRRLLLSNTAIPMTAEAQALLFLASRVQLYESVIRPTLERGAVVIADRFHISTLVYQGVAGDLGLERAREIVLAVLGERRPDLNVVLDLPLEKCLKRLAGIRDRFEEQPEFLAQVAAAFSDAPRLPGDRVVRVSAEGDPVEVASRVVEEVARVVPR